MQLNESESMRIDEDGRCARKELAMCESMKLFNRFYFLFYHFFFIAYWAAIFVAMSLCERAFPISSFVFVGCHYFQEDIVIYWSIMALIIVVFFFFYSFFYALLKMRHLSSHRLTICTIPWKWWRNQLNLYEIILACDSIKFNSIQ